MGELCLHYKQKYIDRAISFSCYRLLLWKSIKCCLSVEYKIKTNKAQLVVRFE